MSDAVYMNGEVFTLSFPFISLTILSTIMEILIWEKKEKKKNISTNQNIKISAIEKRMEFSGAASISFST